jgi:hypothetical protein
LFSTIAGMKAQACRARRLEVEFFSPLPTASSLQPDKARDPPEPDEPVIEPWLDDPFPDYHVTTLSRGT